MQKRGRSGKQYYNPQSGRYSEGPYAPIRLQNYDFPIPPPIQLQLPIMKRQRIAPQTFNTNSEQLYSRGIACPFSDISAEQAFEIPLPSAINQDGTITACEIVRLDVQYPKMGRVTSNEHYMSFYTESPNNTPDNLLANKQLDKPEVMITDIWCDAVRTENGINNMPTLVQYFLDNNGTGISIADSRIFIAFDATTAQEKTFYAKVWYKIVTLTTTAYVGLKR